MKRELLTDKELDELSAVLTNWDVSADGLERSYDFGNFVIGGEIDYDCTQISDSGSGIDLDNVAQFETARRL